MQCSCHSQILGMGALLLTNHVARNAGSFLLAEFKRLKQVIHSANVHRVSMSTLLGPVDTAVDQRGQHFSHTVTHFLHS